MTTARVIYGAFCDLLANHGYEDVTTGEAWRTCQALAERLDKPYLTHAEAAARIGITPRHLYRLVDNGEIKPDRVGKRLRYPVEDVESLVKTHTAPNRE